jgi:hypothetical protein
MGDDGGNAGGHGDIHVSSQGGLDRFPVVARRNMRELEAPPPRPSSATLLQALSGREAMTIVLLPIWPIGVKSNVFYGALSNTTGKMLVPGVMAIRV